MIGPVHVAYFVCCAIAALTEFKNKSRHTNRWWLSIVLESWPLKHSDLFTPAYGSITIWRKFSTFGAGTNNDELSNSSESFLSPLYCLSPSSNCAPNED